jgi:ankyrin repeat protein
MDLSKKTSSGKWSVALAVIPAGIALLLGFLIMLPVWTGHAIGEATWGPMVAIYGLLIFGSHALIATSLLGIAFGLFAASKTTWKKGKIGTFLNLFILLLAGSYLFFFYHSKITDPDQLPIAASKGDYETVKKLVNRGFDINHECLWGERGTALSKAASRGHEQIVEFLLLHGADANISNPLEKALNNGNPKIVQMLLDHGAAPDYPNKVVNSPNDKALQLLLENKADANHRDKYGKTLLHFAVKNSEEKVKMLIENGADVNAQDDQGFTPLYTAVMHGQLDSSWSPVICENVVDMLLKAGADIEARAVNNMTPLYCAANSYQPSEGVRILLERGANPENIEDIQIEFVAAPISMSRSQLESWVRDHAPNDINTKYRSQQTLLYSAVKSNHLDLIEILLDMGANINAQDESGNTPLHEAIKNFNVGALQLLLDRKANVNKQNKGGQTPLHLLIFLSARNRPPYDIQIRAYELLLSNGARVEIKDSQGRSPLELQQQMHHEVQADYQKEFIQLLQKYQNM